MKNSIKIIPEDKSIPLLLKNKLLSQILYLHKEVEKGKEWSGIVFYDAIGDISDIDNFKIEAVEVYILDIGSPGFTEFSLGTHLIDVYADRPHLIGKMWGMIHSHHSMATFFSGTDSENLHDSAQYFNYYLSLIVNYAGEYCAKVSMKGNISNTQKLIKTYKNNSGEFYTKTVDVETNEDVVYVYNCNISWESESEKDLITSIKANKPTMVGEGSYYRLGGRRGI